MPYNVVFGIMPKSFQSTTVTEELVLQQTMQTPLACSVLSAAEALPVGRVIHARSTELLNIHNIYISLTFM